jgi:DNA end-binding protein Ku
MAARAIWKGDLKLNSTRVPVKLYSAVQDRTVRFHILEEKSKTRVKQHMIEPDSGKEITSDEIQKGFEVEPGTFVILNEEELQKLEPEPSREIEIAQFVSPTEIPPEYFDRPYYLGPDGNESLRRRAEGGGRSLDVVHAPERRGSAFGQGPAATFRTRA